MDEEKEYHNPVKPLIRPDKNFVFKNNKYPIDFGLIKKYSNYFYNERKQYKTMKDIPLQLNEYEICEESIPVFIACCQNQPFEITKSTVFSLYQLSIQYDVPELYKRSDEYIKKNHKNLVLQSIQFKIQNDNSEVNIDLSKEEETISSHFFEYINDEQLSSLPVHILYRIINGHQLNFNSMNSTNQNQFIEFLFKCLDKHKKEASVLFSNLDFENGRVDFFSRLLRDYPKDFDFGMINPKFMMKTFSELLNDLNKLEIESTNKISEMQSEIQKQKELLISYQKSSDELKISFENLQKEISEQRKSYDEHKIEYENMKEKIIEMEKIIKEPSSFIEKFSQTLVTHIAINPDKSFLVVGKAMTFTAKVTPSSALNKDVEWKVDQQEEGSIEIVDGDEKKLTIKGIKLGKKVRIIAASIDGSGIEAVKELFTAHFKCEFNLNVRSDQVIKGAIQITEMGVTLDKEKSKYLLNTDNSKVIGESNYNLCRKFENLTQNVSFMKSKGTYYLHVLAVDNYGNSEEFVSNSITTNGVSPLTFDYTGSVQSVELESGQYKLEVWGAQGATAFYYSSSYIRTGGKGGYSVGTISLKSKTKLFIYVGGKGVPQKSGQKVEGGFNGGGYNADKLDSYEKGVGGGGTDIRVNVDSLYSRVIVAGGGGGGNGATSGGGSTGGAGGGVNGCVGVRQNKSNDEHQKTNGSAGTQVSGGKPGIGSDDSHKLTSSGEVIATGVFGTGGSLSSEIYNTMAGAGGGGWYGGGAGNGHGGGGAGGSGWIFTESNYYQWKLGNSKDANQYILDSSYYLINAQTISGESEFINTSGTSKETGHCGNGFAKITPL
ncbi:hypothetical protein M9Y10_039250 [Tritrichomonas musculus]|uniref:receptor protein-tyrosine kinase n=1 Tax=Tritrichomonas musculus TaxID=1915356 RepID=A0ABR2KBQ6_9EUKA